MAKKKKKTTGLFPSFSPTALDTNISTDLKNVEQTISQSIEFGVQESGKFNGYARRITTQPDGKQFITGTAEQTRYSTGFLITSDGTLTDTLPDGKRLIVTDLIISIHDTDNSLLGTIFYLKQGSQVIRSYYYLDGVKFKQYDLSNPPPTFDGTVKITVDISGVNGIIPSFNGLDTVVIFLNGWLEDI